MTAQSEIVAEEVEKFIDNIYDIELEAFFLKGFETGCDALKGDGDKTEQELSEETLEEPQDGLIITQREQELLSKLIYCEARGEDLKGQILVANVILNRVNSSNFPDTIEAVIYQTNQFSPVTNGSLETAQPDELNQSAVEKALWGLDYSQGALYFRAKSNSKGSWHEQALTYLFEYGNHVFYK